MRYVRERLVKTGTLPTSDGSVYERSVDEIWPVAIPGDAGQAVRDWVVNERAASTIETGLAYGISTLFICEGLLLTEHPSVSHVAFDPYQDVFWSNIGHLVVEEAGLGDVVEIGAEDSAIGLGKLVEQGRRFDLAFVDGNHLFDGVLIDLVFFNRLVRPGGIVIVDDLWLPAVARASRFATTNLGWTMEQEGVGEHQMAVFRTPRAPHVREWDHYVDF